jgi:hypothetical protein
MTTGQTPDISEYTEFGFFEMLWYYDEMAVFPEDRRKLSRWLGVAHRIGQALCYYLLNQNAQIIVRSTVQRISQDELQTQVNITATKEFNDEIERRIGKYGTGVPVNAPVRGDDDIIANRIMYDEYEDDADEPPPPLEEEAEKPEIANFTPEAYDRFIAVEAMLPQGDI